MTSSQFSRQLTKDSGIVSLMEDLGEALNVNPDLLFLGGGNPAYIPEFERIVARHLKEVAENPAKLHKLIGIYQSPKGDEVFISDLAKYFRKQCGWNISEKNITISNGSQSAFFSLINLITSSNDHGKKEILFPLMPEYLGYADQSLQQNVFRGVLPLVQEYDENQFKYHVDFDCLAVSDSTAALCVSRPTNPTGNIITQDELMRLNELSLSASVPLIVDCAYGNPFPGIVYDVSELLWNENNIFVLSLSKLGLPGVRTGIVVANEEVIDQLVSVNTIMNLANGNFGPVIMNSILEKGELPHIVDHIISPFYSQKREFILLAIKKYFVGFDYAIHKPEGAFFLWVWFKNLPISSAELYERLKRIGVLVMNGEYFFFGVDDTFTHARQCLRISYCQSDDVLDKAIRLIALEVNKIIAE